jgi:hypothetical protein
MNEAAALLTGTHDFRCFEKAGSDNRTSICTVTEAFWAPYTPDHVAVMGFAPAAPRPGNPPSVLPGDHPSVIAGDSTFDVSATPTTQYCHSEHLPCHSERDKGVYPPEPLYLYFRIAADRFLRNMVRAIVGSLIEVGRGRRTVADFAALILPPDFTASSPVASECPDSPADSGCPDSPATAESNPSAGPSATASTAESSSTPAAAGRLRTAPDGTPFRSLAGESVPGHALFLSRVDY